MLYFQCMTNPPPKDRPDGLDSIRLDRVKAEKVSWLWREHIPFGMISVVAGRPDQGKGLFAAYLAADASRRGINVLYSAIEDSHGTMTRPRLEAAGANMKRIHLMWDDFRLPLHFARLEKEIKLRKAGLLVIDPLAAHLSQGVSRQSDSIRKVSTPLKKLAEKYGMAVLIIDHVTKKVARNSHPLAAIGGSGSGLPSAARAAYLFGATDTDDDRRVLCPIKFNIEDWPLALSFEIDVVEIEGVNPQPALVFEETVAAFDPMHLLIKDKDGGGGGGLGRPPDKRAAASEWLATYLAMAGAPVLGSKVLEDAKQYGMSEKTLRRAAKEMEIIKRPPTGKNSAWELPTKLKEAMGVDTSPKPPADDMDKELRKLLGGDDGTPPA
jgi:hypothetical protein